MLNLPSDGKAWKQKKISLQDFESAVGDIEASVWHFFIAASKAEIKD